MEFLWNAQHITLHYILDSKGVYYLLLLNKISDAKNSTG